MHEYSFKCNCHRLSHVFHIREIFIYTLTLKSAHLFLQPIFPEPVTKKISFPLSCATFSHRSPARVTPWKCHSHIPYAVWSNAPPPESVHPTIQVLQQNSKTDSINRIKHCGILFRNGNRSTSSPMEYWCFFMLSFRQGIPADCDSRSKCPVRRCLDILLLFP